MDWGTNTIGTDAPNTYRTLTYDEWKYLLETRTNASNLKGVARINLNEDGTQYANGLILLPDAWVCPTGVTFKSGFGSEMTKEAYADFQTFTIAQWKLLEDAGAVFLPASGERIGTTISWLLQIAVDYCSSTVSVFSGMACTLLFGANAAIANGGIDCSYGCPVRLVQDL